MTLRRYLALTEAAASNYTLLPGLPPENYQIGPFSQIDEWKAKILLANSPGEGQDVGQWDDVGYVMISLTTNDIIPIARADEHNTGYDLLHDLQRGRKKIKLDPRNFVPLYKGQNFVYSTDEIKKITIVAKKWLDWGGPDCVIRGTYDMDGLYGRLSDLVKHGLAMLPQPGKLNITGDRLLKSLHALAELTGRYEIMVRGGRPTEAVERSIFRAAKLVGRESVPILEHLWIEQPKPDSVLQTIADCETHGDVKSLVEFVFGFHGIKNAIHQKVRESIASKQALRSREAVGVFGDLDLANGMLGNL